MRRSARGRFKATVNAEPDTKQDVDASAPRRSTLAAPAADDQTTQHHRNDELMRALRWRAASFSTSLRAATMTRPTIEARCRRRWRECVRPEEGVWGRRCPPPPRVHRLSVVRHGANEGASLSEAATFGWSPGHSGACHNRDDAQRQRWRRQRRGDAAAVQILALSPLQ
jgi:hypothetical protein